MDAVSSPQAIREGAKRQGPQAGLWPNGSGATSCGGALGVALQRGSNDADGSDLVSHAKPDDYKVAASGASGDRVACAVLSAPRG